MGSQRKEKDKLMLGFFLALRSAGLQGRFRNLICLMARLRYFSILSLDLLSDL